MLKIKYVTVIAAAALCFGAAAQTVPDSLSAVRGNTAAVAVEAASAVAVNVGITELLKNTVHKERPDCSGNDAFPSRHTSWAFTMSAVLSNQFYSSCPWVPPATQAIASGIALQRLHAGRHSGTDIAAGMAIGCASAELGRFLSRLICGRPQAVRGADARFGCSLSSYSNLALPCGAQWSSGFAAGIRGMLPLGAHWGLAADAGAFAIGRNDGVNVYTPAIEGIKVTAGVACGYDTGIRSLAIVSDIVAGMACMRRCECDFAFTASARAGVRWHLTDNFAADAELGAAYLSSPVLFFTVGVSSVWLF